MVSALIAEKSFYAPFDINPELIIVDQLDGMMESRTVQDGTGEFPQQVEALDPALRDVMDYFCSEVDPVLKDLNKKRQVRLIAGRDAIVRVRVVYASAED